MITKNEYRAMFTADRDAARETVKAWRNAVEAIDRIQTADLPVWSAGRRVPEHREKVRG